MQETMNRVPFALGRCLATEGVSRLAETGEIDCLQLLLRHQAEDWGDLSDSDKVLNEQGLRNQGRLVSRYCLHPQLTVWVITEWDRSVTTVLLPSEY